MRRLAVSKCDHESASRTKWTVASFSPAGWTEGYPARAGRRCPRRGGLGARATDIRRGGRPCPHGSLIVEALGYLGGVLIVVAASLSPTGTGPTSQSGAAPRCHFPPQRFLLPQDGSHIATLQNAPGGCAQCSDWALLPADLRPSRPSSHWPLSHVRAAIKIGQLSALRWRRPAPQREEFTMDKPILASENPILAQMRRFSAAYGK